ncbi:DUF1616 domain-containing protein [Haladaptatus sp. DYF46]|uniref:DUF1616 domain-containing protein n=1 Tax=Haladaptatus sp. DYF46 TaxID=2886041 RepID=UPI001E471C62|nr:DUF1616 domain-containing protein [Haladaptatus sp. DYF46]
MSHETNDSWWAKITQPVLEFPVDLAILGIVVILLSLALVQPMVYGTPLAVALGLPLVFFAPGYALVAFLFPKEGSSQSQKWTSPARVRQHGVTGGERCALSFGVSVALLTPVGVLFSLARLPFVPVYVIAAVAAFTLLVSIFAVVRRFNVPKKSRLSVSVRGGVTHLYRVIFHEESAADVVLNLALVLSVIVALTTVGFAVAAPQDGEHFSNLSLLTRNDNGDYVTEGYPTNITAGESNPVFVSVQNHEDETTEYTVVAQLQRVEQRPNGGARVTEREEIGRFDRRVSAGERWRTRHDIDPTMTGEDLRLVYLLYKGDPPSDPTTSNAAQHTQIWVNVTA